MVNFPEIFRPCNISCLWVSAQFLKNSDIRIFVCLHKIIIYHTVFINYAFKTHENIPLFPNSFVGVILASLCQSSEFHHQPRL